MSAVRERRLGKTAGTTRFWWIRHAVVPAASGGRIAGQADLACDLSDTATVDWLRANRPPEDFVFAASPLNRAVATGTAVAERAPDEIDPRLIEQDFGAWTHQTWPQVDDSARAIGFWDDPVVCAPPEGESFAAQCARVAEWIEDARHRLAGRDVLVACHGGTVRAAIVHALGLAPEAAHPALRLVIDNLSLTRIDTLQEGAAVHCINALPNRTTR